MCERYTDPLPLTRPQVGTWPTTQACALTGNQTSDLSVHRPALNPLSHTSQGKVIYFILHMKKLCPGQTYSSIERIKTGGDYRTILLKILDSSTVVELCAVIIFPGFLFLFLLCLYCSNPVVKIYVDISISLILFLGYILAISLLSC